MADALPVLLMTRPQAASERFVREVEATGLRFRALISPVIEIVFRGTLPDMADVRGVIFTSANGVAAYAAAGGPLALPAFTVGEATAQAARELGLQATCRGQNAEALTQALTGARGPLIHVCGAHRRGAVAQRLSESGTLTREAVLYDQPERALSEAAKDALRGEEPVVAPVFSPRSGAILAAAPVSAPVSVAAMSEAVANAVTSLHKREVRIALQPDSGAMRDVVVALLTEVGARRT